MAKQTLGQLNSDVKDFFRSKKKNEIYEIRKKLLKKNLKKRKIQNKVD